MAHNAPLPDNSNDLQNYCPLRRKSLLSLLLWKHKRLRLGTFTNVLGSFIGSYNLSMLKWSEAQFSHECPESFLILIKTRITFKLIITDISNTLDWSIYIGRSKWHKRQRSMSFENPWIIDISFPHILLVLDGIKNFHGGSRTV